MNRMTTAALAGLLALSMAGPVAAAGVLGKTPTKPSESIGPAAPGDPKPYNALAPGECSGSACAYDFGKKGNKTRTIAWVNCVVTTSTGVTRLAAVLIDGFGNQAGYFSKVSSVIDGGDETAVLEYKNPVVVPPGANLFVYAVTTGTPGGGQCTLGGTIE